MEFRRKKRAPVEIGLIPMIDVLLVLLFFFMVATTFRHHTNLKINLPEASGEEREQASKAINLFIDADGKYAIAGEDGKAQPLAEQSLQSLKDALAAFSGDAKQLPFIISADGKTPHQAVVGALDVANQLGFNHVTFAINPPEK
ncbi:ExbD/TolR family protein [Methylomonas rapida]|jgi:Biopolymer transport protein|uniref:Biopolymer transporter ExbD n=1 Tax=Methylomonas rapida TaxID=2963939 RepID=A0ABY7GGV5_9GAMM|nr:biopolymer transporter ExbD [Methylomonas rapida]WAR43238.1 biopolymer transporter ExbD [Methylomonas rapida]